MAADEVHHRVEIFFRIILAQALHAAHRKLAVDIAHEEIKEVLPQRIVHCAVHLVAAEIFALLAVRDLVRRVLPDLADHDGIGVRGLELLFVHQLQADLGNVILDVALVLQ